MQQKVLEIVANETFEKFERLYTIWLIVDEHESKAAFSKLLKNRFSDFMKIAT